MIDPIVLWVLGFMALVPLAAVPLLSRYIARQERLALRMWEVRRIASREDLEGRPEIGGNIFTRSIEAIGTAMIDSGMLSASTLNEVTETLTNTRLRGSRGLSLFIGLKMVLLVGLPLLLILVGSQFGMTSGSLLSISAVAAIIGLLAPDYVIKSIRARYLKQVEAGLADALDMMVICAEAGLGLEAAIERVSEEIAIAHRNVSLELIRTSQDLRLISDRKVALTNMGTRTGLDSMKRLATMLVQSSQLGTPLTKALRTISNELRQEALTRFEARAARLPVLLTVPMIVFILPCVFIVVAGPAGLQAMRAFHH
jgi:tight adherence protein C